MGADLWGAWEMEKQSDQVVPDRLRELIEPVVAGCGLELVELLLQQRGRRQLLRILVDRAGGVTIDDCTAVSRRVSADLDMAELIDGRYTLEVSSPGLDRPLTTPADFRRKIGRKIKLRYAGSGTVRKALTGVVRHVSDDSVTVDETVVEWQHVIEGKLTI